ncbi:MAG: hypothetical protein IID44_23220 [Planctomycetes bacterium]|nr:hypothetical protein [Planctomycetota bacterium]
MRNITLPDKTLQGSVAAVASVTQPAGWWTGNVVRYDTIIQLPSLPGLRPGMSAEVEVLIARLYSDHYFSRCATIRTPGLSRWLRFFAADLP